MVKYNEPCPETGEPKTIILTEEEAIRISKRCAKNKGFEYPSDQHALDDFLIIHWAWVEE